MNLDRFKRINETLGHRVGDQLLQTVSERLVNCLRKSDSVARQGKEGAAAATVSRIGGDEFTILLTNIMSPEDPARVARRILARLAQPFTAGEQELFLTASIGISVFPSDGTDVESLLKNAGTAMSHAKEEGKNTYQFYSQAMNATAFQRLALENSLRKALDRGEFVLHYQPQVDIGRWKIIGVEALIRWKHPDLGMVPPSEFIPLAEEAGLIALIGEWTLQTACAQNKAWQDAGFAPIRMAVNISGLQFGQQNLMESITRTLHNSGLPPEHLELELTEGTIMRDAEATITTLRQFKEMGLRLAIDDFGTGYSSLSYLKRFPLDTLKIDRSFLLDFASHSDDTAIITAIIAMARSLKLRVLAEGVETEQQLAFLRQQGCDEIQGYLFSKPIPADAMTQLLQANRGQRQRRCVSVPVGLKA